MGGVRVELTRPLRVGSGHTSSPGVDPPRRQPDHRDLRQGGPRLPELDEGVAGGEVRATRTLTRTNGLTCIKKLHLYFPPLPTPE